MHDIIVSPRFADLMPRLTPEEFAQLEKEIVADGCRDPLIIWQQKKILLDGHNRKVICDKHRMSYTVRYLMLPDHDAAEAWIVNHQLGRRNLTDAQRTYYMGKEYLLKRKAEGRPGKLGQNDQVSGPTREKLAEKHDVSPRTIQRAAEFTEALDAATPAARAKVLSGQAGVSPGAVLTGRRILCERCHRVAPGQGIAGCRSCADLRQNQHQDKQKGGKPRAETVPEYKAVSDLQDRLRDALHKLPIGGGPRSPRLNGACRLMDELTHCWREWLRLEADRYPTS